MTTMIRNRTAAIAFLALAIGLAFGFAWWAIFAKNSVDAAAQLSAACAQTEAQKSFDFQTIVTTPKFGVGDAIVMETSTVNARISGQDYHIELTGGSEGDSEALGVDGVNTYATQRAGGNWKSTA